MPRIKPLTDDGREAIRESILDDVMDHIEEALDELTQPSHICSGDYDGPRLTKGQVNRAKRQLEGALAQAIDSLE